jgi:hypothetical protein
MQIWMQIRLPRPLKAHSGQLKIHVEHDVGFPLTNHNH